MNKLLLIVSLIFCLGIGDRQQSKKIERQLDDLIEQLKKTQITARKYNKLDKIMLSILAVSFGTVVVMDLCYEKNLCGFREDTTKELGECLRDPSREIADCLNCLD